VNVLGAMVENGITTETTRIIVKDVGMLENKDIQEQLEDLSAALETYIIRHNKMTIKILASTSEVSRRLALYGEADLAREHLDIIRELCEVGMLVGQNGKETNELYIKALLNE
jgi:hypothetical protein